MQHHFWLLPVLSAVITIMVTLHPARASDVSGERKFCLRYALEALFVQQANRASRCGSKGDDTAHLWHHDRSRHHALCLAVGRTRAGQFAVLRQKAWQRCVQRLNRTPQPLSCDTFAWHRGQFQQQNRALGCGFTGPLWNDSFVINRESCTLTDWPTLLRQSTQQRTMLLECVGTSR